jgi:predicted nucleotidyltransferase
MQNKEEKYLEEIRGIIARNLHPKRIWLFGSRSKGTQKYNSDFDIAYEGGNASFRRKRKTQEEASEKAGIYSVDIVELEDTSDDFQNLVREEGKIIYERD